MKLKGNWNLRICCLKFRNFYCHSTKSTLFLVIDFLNMYTYKSALLQFVSPIVAKWIRNSIETNDYIRRCTTTIMLSSKPCIFSGVMIFLPSLVEMDWPATIYNGRGKLKRWTILTWFHPASLIDMSKLKHMNRPHATLIATQIRVGSVRHWNCLSDPIEANTFLATQYLVDQNYWTLEGAWMFVLHRVYASWRNSTWY